MSIARDDRSVKTSTTTASSTNIISGRTIYAPITTGTIDISPRKQTYKCEYCDCISEEAGTCKHCSAPLKEVSE